MDEIIFAGYSDIHWNCACGVNNTEHGVQLDSFDGNEYECKSCGKKYVFRASLDLEEIEE